ncbi:MAG: hypothetical protein ACF8QF_11765 [Phycisphaerales bacterium]
MTKCKTLMAVIVAFAAQTGAVAGWSERIGATPDEVLSSLAALGIEPDALVRAVLDGDGALTFENSSSFGDALTVDLRVADTGAYAEVYRRISGAPLPDGFDVDAFAAIVNWALADPDAFLARGGTMNDLRRARRDNAQRLLEDDASVSGRSAAAEIDLPYAGEAIEPTEFFGGAGEVGAIPTPGAATLLGLAGLAATRRSRR